MFSIEDRNESVGLATRMNAERKRLAAEYVAGLSDEELAAQWQEHMPSRCKKLTGREDFNKLSANQRFGLLLFHRRVWEAAGKPGMSDALKAWECYR